MAVHEALLLGDNLGVVWKLERRFKQGEGEGALSDSCTWLPGVPKVGLMCPGSGGGAGCWLPMATPPRGE